jgi:hypothetical protein
MTSPVDFSTGDIWRAASDKSLHSGNGARHRGIWKGLWKVYRVPGCVFFFSVTFLISTQTWKIVVINKLMSCAILFIYVIYVAGRGGKQFFTCCSAGYIAFI